MRRLRKPAGLSAGEERITIYAFMCGSDYGKGAEDGDLFAESEP